MNDEFMEIKEPRIDFPAMAGDDMNLEVRIVNWEM